MTSVLFRGGPVVTFDGGPVPNAVAVSGGRIVAVGDEAERWRASFDRVVELDGRPLLPAFRDGHAHPLHAGTNRLSLDFTGISTLDGTLDALRRWRVDHSDEAWVVGRCYDPSILPDAFGRAEWLDAACPDRPVTLYPTDNHAVWANSAAMAAAGITADTPEPPLGEIVRDGDGAPIGMFLEFGGMGLFDGHVPTIGTDTQHRGLAKAIRLMSMEGIVWAQDASVRLDELDVYLDRARAGAPCGFNAAFRADPATWRRQRDGFVEGRRRAKADGGRPAAVSANTIKFFADGVIEAGTGYLLEPYEDAPHSCGLPNWSAEGLAEAVRAFDADGFQIHVHAIGDAGVRMALDAIEHAARQNGRRDRRPVIAHTQLVHPADRPRFVALGVIANFEPLWAQHDDSMLDLTFPRLGPQRSALQYPIGTLARSGAPISFGSDWPVSSHRPLDGLATAVTRLNARGEPFGGWLPEERIPILQAIRAYTKGSAYQAFDDDVGEIAVGQRADLIVLDQDITAIAGEEIAGAQVDQTWLAGAPVYER
ncbi:MAG: amidohydrolase [Ilumatobacteraceae bacterium]|nr:amidohydrolase [Ilumatobacteraceae bacterium]